MDDKTFSLSFFSLEKQNNSQNMTNSSQMIMVIKNAKQSVNTLQFGPQVNCELRTFYDGLMTSFSKL